VSFGLGDRFAQIDARLLPAGEAAVAILLSTFEPEKAIYELQYALEKRADYATPGSTRLSKPAFCSAQLPLSASARLLLVRSRASAASRSPVGPQLGSRVAGCLWRLDGSSSANTYAG
jgi:hypothetical protein